MFLCVTQSEEGRSMRVENVLSFLLRSTALFASCVDSGTCKRITTHYNFKIRVTPSRKDDKAVEKEKINVCECELQGRERERKRVRERQ